jgi:tetratricopeptide (TPR) repeat protein
MRGVRVGGDRIIGKWFIAAAGALLVAAPVVLTAAEVKDWRWLTAAALVAAVAALFAGVGKARLERAVQRSDSRAEELAKGTFTPGGKLPRVRDVTDPIGMIGVHPAARRDDSGGDRVPVYVPRDIDDRLRAELARRGFVLLVGDSTAGKTRAAFEAVRAVLPDHVLVVPDGREGVPAAVAAAVTLRRCVLWLNDLDRFVGAGGLSAKSVSEVLAGVGHHRVIVATLRAVEEDRITAGRDGAEGRQVQRDSQAVLDQAHRIFLERRFSTAEQERAADLAEDDVRIADALTHADTFGIAEYLASGPQLFTEWENAWSKGHQPRAAALIAAAIDIRRAGYTAPLTKALLQEAHTLYLDQRGGSRLNPEPEEKAWQWATRIRDSGNAPLHTTDGETHEVFDYLLDTMQRRTPAGDQVPQKTITTALHHAAPADAVSIGATAQNHGLYRLAEIAINQALTAYHDQHGAEHPSTLISRSNLASVLCDLGRLQEAEAEYRAVLEAQVRVLGAEHPSTLDSRSDLASVLGDLGRFQEAEAECRAVLEASVRVLGAEHPSTLTSRNNLASVLRDLGRFQQAEAEHRAVLEAQVRVLGGEHPSTLISRSNLASVLCDLGRFQEAEAEHRAVLEVRTRVLGAEHPSTLDSRSNLASVLCDLGRLEEAEAEHRGVLETQVRALGAEHPSTLTSRSNLAGALCDLGRLQQAEAEHRAVLEIRTRVLGAEHPSTLTSRNNLASALCDLGRLQEAEAEHRAVLETQVRALGGEHPSTLTSRDNLARVLWGLGRLQEAEAEHRAVLEVRTRVLGGEHPSTLISRSKLASVLSDLGRLQEAEAEHRAVLEVRTRVLGAEHPSTLASRDYLASVLRAVRKSH